MTATNQRANARIAAEALAPLCAEHEVVITHGNGPQVGLLALQELAYPGEDAPLDVLGAETEGAIGYMIEQELGNLLPFEKPLATLLTMVEVDPDDPAFQDPTKFIGQVYDEAEAKAEAAAKGWTVKPDGKNWRRVVPSPLPKRIFQLRPIQWLLEKGTVVIAAGGGGIPTMYEKGTRRARRRRMRDRQGPRHRAPRPRDRRHRLRLRHRRRRGLPRLGQARASGRSAAATPDAMDAYAFPAGSMGPKVEAAQDFARATGGRAIICALADVPAAVRGEKGTTIAGDAGETDRLPLRRGAHASPPDVGPENPAASRRAAPRACAGSRRTRRRARP